MNPEPITSELLKSLRQEWECSISKSTPEEPVVTCVGHTYDKVALDRWLLTKNRDPFTNLILENKKSYPNLTLKKVIHKLEEKLPQVGLKILQKDFTIRQLEEDNKELRIQLEEQIALNQADQKLSEGRQEYILKTKKIQKASTQTQKERLKKLRRMTDENMKQNQTIQQLTIKLINLQSKLENEQKKMQKQKIKMEELIENQMINKDQLKMAWQIEGQLEEELRKAVNLTNIRLGLENEYRRKIFQAFHDFFLEQNINQNSVQMGTLDQIKEKNYQKVLSLMETERNKKLSNPLLTQNEKTQKNFFYGQNMNYVKIIRLGEKLNLKNLIGTTSIIEMQMGLFKFGNISRAIPYSIPPTEDELSIDWGSVIVIHLGSDYPVNNQLWELFISNANRFAGLIDLVIENSEIRNITQEQLNKLTHAKRISFRRTAFTSDSLRALEQFQMDSSVRITNERRNGQMSQ